MNSTGPRITGWTNWNDPNYENLKNARGAMNYRVIFNMVSEELKKHGYKFSGYSHQHEKFGVPILNDTYKICCSCHEWGIIMADAYEENTSKENDFKWQLAAPQGETEILPPRKN